MYVGFDVDVARFTTAQFLPASDTPGVVLHDNFGSAHPSGFNVVMCDGSARNVGYDIEADVWVGLGYGRTGRCRVVNELIG